MKIILTQEVSGLGTPGDVVEVKDGFGRNYLMPQGFAIRWSKGAEKQVTLIKRARGAREIRDMGHANEVKVQLENLKVSHTARAGEGGRLFGSVTPADVAAAVRAAGGPELDRRRIELPGHIKSTGAYQVSVKLHPEVTATIAFSVLAAKGSK
jgi:large subunit ribosomal protein L9